MGKYIYGLISGIIITVIGSIIVYFVVAYLPKVDTNKIIAYLPYANDYVYPDGTRYKNATSDPPSQMPRDIDPDNPIPLDIKNAKQKLTIGVRNLNKQTLDNVRLFLIIPHEIIEADEPKRWQKYSDEQYNISLGDIQSGIGHNAVEPIFFKVKKPGPFKILYMIIGRDFKISNREIIFKTYEK